MPRVNEEVAQAFEELADLMQIAGGDRFKIVAYRRVAEEVRALARDISTLDDKELSTLRGVGRATSSKIREVLNTGTMAKLEDARAEVPKGIREMTALPGLGPKTALLLHSELGVTNLTELDQAIKEQRLRTIKGLGKRTEENLTAALRRFKGKEERAPIDVALRVAEALLEELRQSDLVTEAAYCGSLRRGKETIGDLDLLATGPDPGAIMNLFTTLPAVTGVPVSGSTKSSIRTREGLQVDLRVVAADEFGAALQYFTGSKEHNVRVREIAVKQGYKLSEYGVFRVSDNSKVAGATEDDVYAALGLQTPPAPMRENRGEVELALKGEIPELVQLADIQGDLHMHTRYSDGSTTVREMARTAMGLGRSYIAITDHLDAWVKSHSPDTVKLQAEEIARANEEFGGRITILQGVEVDIGPEGTLALPDSILDRVDLVIASIHRRYGLDAEAMTRRVVKAMQHPKVNIFGHPTGRWLGQREAAEFDLEQVFAAAKENQVAMEINSNPARLDLKDDHIRLGKEYGLRFSINTDSHNPGHLSRMRLGVGMAQRGWVTAPEVINTLQVDEIRKVFLKS
ncbi:MAG TPA: DNA polymerase/3'-5' exonuclease PolX [Actinomycetota bacterium]|jgi:DNA polymerase (family 10)|nr:DNA polymerase/3'-5' exonuclease PolX [Actinomycetota bacterium]